MPANGYVYQLYCDGQYEPDDLPPLDLFEPPHSFPDADAVQEDEGDLNA